MVKTCLSVGHNRSSTPRSPMRRACRRTSRRCEVRVHEQIRRSTGPAERVHPGSPETRAGGGPACNISVSRGYRTRPASPSNSTNVLPPTRPGQAVNVGMLVPERRSNDSARCTSDTSMNPTGDQHEARVSPWSSTGMFCLLAEPFSRAEAHGAAIVVGQSPAVARDHHSVPSTGQSR